MCANLHFYDFILILPTATGGEKNSLRLEHDIHKRIPAAEDKSENPEHASDNVHGV